MRRSAGSARRGRGCCRRTRSRASSKRPAIARSSDRLRVISRLEYAGRLGSTRAAPRSGGSRRRPATAPCGPPARKKLSVADDPSDARPGRRTPRRGRARVRVARRALAASTHQRESHREQSLGESETGRRRRAARTSRPQPRRPAPPRPDRGSGSRTRRWCRALHERAQREASLLQAGRGVDARCEHRIGLRHPPCLAEGVGEIDLDARALARVADPERERTLEQVDGGRQVAADERPLPGGGEPVGGPPAERAGLVRRAAPSSVAVAVALFEVMAEELVERDELDAVDFQPRSEALVKVGSSRLR